RAFELETQIAADLEQVLDILRNRGPQREKTLDEIRNAECELAALRQQLANLREQAARAEGQGNRAQREQFGKQQDELRREAERLARQMERLEAREAGQSTQSAADQLN